ncbi:hypothetical protein NIES25_44070 [Nostoc linckia NIES-25]|nr:hypothetical protein NIES25_44070 [Nostoc linckia NIES-25]
MADEQPKIVVEVPSDRGHYSPRPIPIPQPNKLEEFKKGWIEAIAFGDNIPDLAYDLASTVAIPALLSNCWVTLSLPGFIRLGVWGVLAVSGVMVFYLHQAIPEIQTVLLLRVGLIALGVLLGI